MAPKINHLASVFDWMGHYWIGYLMLFGIIISTAILGIAIIKDEVYQRRFTQVFMVSSILSFTLILSGLLIAFIV